MQEIKDQTDWLNILEMSMDKTIAIFKHSNTCPISRNAYEKILKGISEQPAKKSLIFLLVVQDHPNLKETIAKDCRIAHESPQIIILKNKETILSQSHGDINWQSIDNML